MKLTQFIVQHSTYTPVGGRIEPTQWSLKSCNSYEESRKIWTDLYKTHGPNSSGKALTGLLWYFVTIDHEGGHETGVYEQYIKQVKAIKEYNL